MPNASSRDAAAAWPPDARAWVEVDLGALQRNARAIERHAGAPLLPMVKADGYGLGAVAIARALAPLQPWGFGVATLDEARALRAAGVPERVMIITPMLPRDYAAARALGVTPALGSADALAAWRDAGGGPYHLGIDTGMARAGVRWDEVGALADVLAVMPPEGAFTHYHSAEAGDGSTAVQRARFAAALAAMPARPPLVHVENSGGVSHLDAPSAYSFVRPGIFLYGVACGGAIEPEPVVTFRAPVVELRRVAAGESVSYGATFVAPTPRTIATASVGYADGYRRSFSNRGHALLAGRRVPVAGLVTMDMTMFDVSDVPCAVGDAMTLIGRDGLETLDVATLARAGDLSPYELLAGLGLRAPRVYVGGSR